MTVDEKQALIEGHFNRQLSDEEVKQFEHLRQEDAVFKEMVEQHQALLDAVDQATEQDLKAYLGTVEQEFARTTNKRKILPLKHWLAIAASILLVIVASYLFLPRTVNHTTLFAQHFEPFRNVAYPISRAGELPTQLDSAFYFYEQGAYAKAIPIFEQLMIMDHDTIPQDAIVLYLGIAYLSANQAEQAKTLFLQTTNSETDEFISEKRWYLALTYIKLEDSQKAREVLNKLAASSNKNWKNRAEELLNQL